MPRSARSNTIAWLRCVLLLPLIGGMAVACSSADPTVAPTVRSEVLAVPKVTLIAAAMPAPTSSASPSAAAASAPTSPAYPIATPTATPAPVLRPTLQLAQRVDSMHGWAMAAHQLRWTDDGGAHWRTLAAPLTERQSIANAFFLDINNGWMLIAGPDDPVKLTAQFSILRTHDGGATWESSPLTHYTDCFNCIDRGWGDILAGQSDALMFLNAREGWAQIDRSETVLSLHADLFHTTDGGSTWQKLPTMPVSGAFAFHTPRDGWQLGACCGGAPAQLQQTHDGGQTWQLVEFYNAPDYQAIALPTFFDAATGVVPVAIRDAQFNYVGRVDFYTTDDGGQTWRAGTSFSLGGSTFQAIDRNDWLLGTNHAVYQTANAGQSWRTLSNAAEPVDFIRFMFADDMQGWAIALKPGCGGNCAVLMRTSDGGYGWEALNPFYSDGQIQ
ncbi:MAG: hypothetical protein ABI901_04890 [Roseiflexaceae bacterium]